MNRFLDRVIDYAIDTAIANGVTAMVILPTYYLEGMSPEGLRMVVVGFLTVGWVASFPIAIAIRWVRKRVKYRFVR